MNVTGPYWWYVNIGSGNGLVPSGNKPLPVVIRRASAKLENSFVPAKMTSARAQLSKLERQRAPPSNNSQIMNKKQIYIYTQPTNSIKPFYNQQIMNFVSRYWSTLLFIQLVPVCGYVSATCDFRSVFIKKQNQSTMASSADNPPKLVDKKGAKSSCWAHFGLLASDQSIAVCKLCNKQYVYKGRELVWPFLTQIYCPVTSTLADAKSQLMFNNMILL